MNTKDIIKYVLIAAGAYLLYQWLSKNGYLSQFGIGASTTAGTVAQTQPSSGTTTGASTVPAVAVPISVPAAAPTPAPVPAPVASSTTKDLVAALSKGDTYLNGGGYSGSGPFEHWNHYYNQTTAGKANPGPDPGTVGVDPNASITLDQWWALVSAHGVSGLDGVGLLNSLSRWQSTPSWVV
jgi:hypothetical protein